MPIVALCFYFSYVIAVLIAIKDPSDEQRMKRTVDLVENQQRYKSSRKDVRKITHTLEWLYPKNGRHINSIDSLRHSDDLLKEHPTGRKEIPLNLRINLKVLFEEGAQSSGKEL